MPLYTDVSRDFYSEEFEHYRMMEVYGDEFGVEYDENWEYELSKKDLELFYYDDCSPPEIHHLAEADFERYVHWLEAHEESEPADVLEFYDHLPESDFVEMPTYPASCPWSPFSDELIEESDFEENEFALFEEYDDFDFDEEIPF